MKKLLYISLLFISFSAYCQGSLEEVLNKYNQGNVPYISVDELQKRMQSNSIILLDTREIEEYKISHIENAIWVGFDTFSLQKTMQQLNNKNAEIVVYCSLGVRSEKIGEQLQKAGYTDIKNLYGGIFEWKNKGNPVYDPNGNETEKVHAHSKRWGVWLIKGEKVY